VFHRGDKDKINERWLTESIAVFLSLEYLQLPHDRFLSHSFRFIGLDMPACPRILLKDCRTNFDEIWYGHYVHWKLHKIRIF
jgi:hypothetical protein